MNLREQKKHNTRNAILASADRLFRKHGYSATRINDIIEPAKISKKTFFNYFPSKNAVLAELARRWFQRYTTETGSIASTKSISPGKNCRITCKHASTSSLRIVNLSPCCYDTRTCSRSQQIWIRCNLILLRKTSRKYVTPLAKPRRPVNSEMTFQPKSLMRYLSLCATPLLFAGCSIAAQNLKTCSHLSRWP